MEATSGRNGKIPSLDGLRAISFFIVFLAHAGLESIVPGRLGVDVFFLISGYLITTLMIRERSETGRISLKLFYMRRVLRICPPMYVIIGATLLFLWVTRKTDGITLQGVASQLFFYQNYDFLRDVDGLIPGLGVLWSLAIEEHFYLLFPPAMVLVLGRLNMNYRQVTVALLCTCLAILAWRTFVATTFPNGLEWARDATDCRADSILFGCVLACWEQTDSCRTFMTRNLLERFILPCAVAIILLTLFIRQPLFRETIRYTLQGVALAPVLYYVVHFSDSLIGRVLNLRWLGVLGTLSYAMYLVHHTVLLEVGSLISKQFIAGAFSLVITVALAGIVYRFIERPADAVRRRLQKLALDPVNASSGERLTLSAGAPAE